MVIKGYTSRFIITAVLITIFVFLNTIWSLSSFFKCLCGGCCIGCPGDCNTIGFPLAYYYWGTNWISGDYVSEFSFPNIMVDIVVWIISLALVSLYYFKTNKSEIK